MSGAVNQADEPKIVRAVVSGKFVRVNPSFKSKSGFDAAELAEKPFLDWIDPCDRSMVEAALESGERSFFARHITRDGSTLQLEIQVAAHGEGHFVLGRSAKVPTQSKFDQARSAEATVSGTLDAIARIIEEQHTGYKCSILLVADGRFVFGAGPSLPDEYNSAVNGYAVGPAVGSCGTAIFWNTPVVVEDIQADPLWTPLAALAKKAGVAACWSHPFVSSSGKVLGALALYSSEPCAPTATQLSQLKAAARITGLAVERGRAEEELKLADKAIEAAHNQLQATLNALPDLLFEVSGEGSILSCHTHRSDLLPGTPEVFMGKRFADVLPPDAAGACQRAINQAAQIGFSYGETYRLDLPQGECWFELSVAPLQTDARPEPRFVVISRDISERKQLNVALSRERVMLATLINTLPDLIWLKDADGVYLNCNSRFEQFFGAPVAGIIGKTDYDFVSLEQADFFREHDKKAMEKNGPSINEEEIKFASDGHREILETTKTPMRDESGKLIGVLGISHDITRRKQNEREMHQREQYQRALLDSFPFAVWLKDTESRFLAVNQGFVQLFGQGNTEELVGKTDFDIAPADLAEGYRADDRAVLAAGKKKNVEEEIVNADGTRKWFETYKAPVFDAAGSVVGSVGFARDITERRAAALVMEKMSAALATSRDLLQQIIDTAPVRVFWKDRDCRYLGCNPQFARDAGKQSPAELIGQDDFNMSWAAQAELYRADDQEVMRTGQARVNFEELQTGPDGQTIWLRTSKVPLYDRQGEVMGVLGLYDDITQKKREERRLALALDASKILIWEMDFTTGKLGYDGSAMIGLGLDKSDAPDTLEAWQARVHADDRMQFAKSLEQAQQSDDKLGFDFEYRFKDSADSYCWLQTAGRVVRRDAAGNPLFGAGYSVNIDQRKRAEMALKASELAQRTLIAALPDVIMRFDSEGRHLFVSDNVLKATGLPAAAFIGKAHHQLGFAEPMCVIWDHAIQQPFLTGQAHEIEFELDGPSGHVAFNWRLTPEADADGRVKSVLAVARDITEHKKAKEALRLAADVFTYAREGIAITDPDANILDVNAAFSDITGYSRDEVLGKNPRIFNSGKQDKAFYVAMWHDLLTKGYWHGEVWNRRKDGAVLAGLLTISAVRDARGEIQNYISLFSDITMMKEHQAKLELIAHYDVLTGLPNRLLLGDRLRQAMNQAPRRKRRLAVAYLDLDGFKEVNDTHGHHVGDQLLASLAKRMTQALRDGDTLGRLGGDEFVAVLSDLSDIEASVPILNRLLEAAAQPFVIGDIVLNVSASLGVTFYPQSEEVDADQLLRQADQAMYQAKQAGKNRSFSFDADQDRQVRSHHESLEQIRQALADHQFVLFYQPKVNMRTGEVIGAEALIRWQHPQRGLLPPGEFLPVVENNPLAISLGEWVLDTALAQIEAWRADGLIIKVSVNVGALQLQKPDFVSHLRTLLSLHPAVNPGELELEILETAALEDFSGVSQLMASCHELGVGFALDDFGTGYSSLTYLKQLPASLLKIDQSFVRDMLDDPDDLAILEAILGLATAFRRQIIAEGVETLAHGEMLLRLGCEWAQGYAIARPMPARDFQHWISTWDAPSSWKELKPISRDHLPALFAAVEHRAWISEMADYLSGQRNASPQQDPHQCRFGHWLDHGGRDLLSGDGTELAVDELHRKVHRLATELVASKRDGHADKVLTGISEMNYLRDQLLEQLSKLY